MSTNTKIQQSKAESKLTQLNKLIYFKSVI
jgi:hypothetical protein